MENNLYGINITKSYLEFSLKNVNICVPKGRIVGFVGKNGAGKTTTIKAILNLINKDDGKVMILNEEFSRENTDLYEELGIVFDDCCFPKLMNVDQIGKMMSKVYRKWSMSEFDRLVKKLDIPRKKCIKDFSRGMGMKLSLIVALSHKPKILILDEATSGLDPVVRDEVLDIFLEFVQDEENSILFSSHITTDLEKIADYVVFIKEGEVILDEEKDNLLYEYALIRCYDEDLNKINKDDVVAYRKDEHYTTVLVHGKEKAQRNYSNMIIDNSSIEEIMLTLIKGTVVE